jgi:hypothetical protein
MVPELWRKKFYAIKKFTINICISGHSLKFKTVLWVRIRIRKDPELLVGTGYGSGSVTRGFAKDPKLDFNINKITKKVGNLIPWTIERYLKLVLQQKWGFKKLL